MPPVKSGSVGSSGHQRDGSSFSGLGYLSGDATTPGLKTIEIRDTVTSSSTLRRFLRIKVIFQRFSALKKAPQF